MVSLKVKEALCLCFSGLLFLSGILLIALSIVLFYKVLYHFTFFPYNTIGPFIVIFLLGILHCFLTWLGINGPRREHNFHIVLFMIFAAILLISEFAIGVWTIVLRDEVTVESTQLMTESFNEYKNFLETDKKAWNKVQSQLHCCGLKNHKDYSQSKAFPTSCFIDQNTNTSTPLIYEEGCQRPLLKYVRWILVQGCIISFVATAFQALGIFLFWTFFKTLREERAERIARRVAAQRELAQQGVVQPVEHQNSLNNPPGSNSDPGTPPVTTAA